MIVLIENKTSAHKHTARTTIKLFTNSKRTEVTGYKQQQLNKFHPENRNVQHAGVCVQNDKNENDKLTMKLITDNKFIKI